jgi:type II secretory pathway pseudopilin PulG
VKELSYPSRRSSSLCGGRPQRASAETGYVLLIVMMMATLLLISLAAAVPSIYVEGQREKEKELIFRGEQYARAIMMFHQQFKRYPTSVKELLHTNNMSFLRQPFRDPMTRSGKWRFIHATAAGVILDSKILGPPGKQKNNLFGANGGGAASQSGSSSAQTNQQTTQTSAQQGGLGMGSFSLPGLGQNSGETRQQNGTSSFFGDNKIVGAYIVGVASTSHHQSIGVFDKRTEDGEWEFLGVPGAPGAPNMAGPGAVPAGGAQPGQSPFGGPGSQPNSGGGFHLGPSQPSQPSQPGSIFGGSSNP